MVDSYAKQNSCPVSLITPPNSPTHGVPTSPHPTPRTPTYPHLCKLNDGTIKQCNAIHNDKCTISAGFSSPKRGALCLTPVKLSGKASSTVCFPGLPTPSSHTLTTPTKPQDKTLSSSNCGGTKRSGRMSPLHPSIKRLKLQSPAKGQQLADEVVPETPEKLGSNGYTCSSLCNIQNLLHRLTVAEGEAREDEDGGRGSKKGLDKFFILQVCVWCVFTEYLGEGLGD